MASEGAVCEHVVVLGVEEEKVVEVDEELEVCDGEVGEGWGHAAGQVFSIGQVEGAQSRLVSIPPVRGGIQRHITGPGWGQERLPVPVSHHGEPPLDVEVKLGVQLYRSSRQRRTPGISLAFERQHTAQEDTSWRHTTTCP